MSSRRPLVCCTLDCAVVNGCTVGGNKCQECGGWYCPYDEGDDKVCSDCLKVSQKGKEEEEKTTATKEEKIEKIRKTLLDFGLKPIEEVVF